MRNRADQLTNESEDVNEKLTVVNKLSNLSLQLYSWYIQHGHARNNKDFDELKEYFEKYLPEGIKKDSFYEKLYLYQSYTWYAFIRQDFLQYYRIHKNGLIFLMNIL
jgi:hypothetical protein